jgi:hypothetical protein
MRISYTLAPCLSLHSTPKISTVEYWTGIDLVGSNLKTVKANKNWKRTRKKQKQNGKGNLKNAVKQKDDIRSGGIRKMQKNLLL